MSPSIESLLFSATSPHSQQPTNNHLVQTPRSSKPQSPVCPRTAPSHLVTNVTSRKGSDRSSGGLSLQAPQLNNCSQLQQQQHHHQQHHQHNGGVSSKKRVHPHSVLSPVHKVQPFTTTQMPLGAQQQQCNSARGVSSERNCMSVTNKTNRRIVADFRKPPHHTVVKKLDFSSLVPAGASSLSVSSMMSNNNSNELQETQSSLSESMFEPMLGESAILSPKIVTPNCLNNLQSFTSPKKNLMNGHYDSQSSWNMSPATKRRNFDSFVTSPTSTQLLHADRFIPQRCSSSEMEIAKHLMFTSNEGASSNGAGTPSSNSQANNTNSTPGGGNNGNGSSSNTNSSGLMNVPYQFESCLESRLLDSKISEKKIFKFKPNNYANMPIISSLNDEESNGAHQSDYSMRSSFDDANGETEYNNQENIRRGNIMSTPAYSPKRNSVQNPTSADTNIQNKLQAVFSCNKQFSQMTEMEKRQMLQGGYSGMTSRQRVIPAIPERILDAPKMVDDFYLNLLDWSSQNVLAVALYDSVYLWDANNGSITELMRTDEEEDEPDNTVTSVAWTIDGHHIAIGTNNCTIEIWNVEHRKMVRQMSGHASRVGSLSWNPRCQSILSSGSRDGKILNHDVRIGPGGLNSGSNSGLFMHQHEAIPNYPNQVTSVFSGHNQEVCGLKWSPDGTQLASGGNDNTLHIWDANGPSFAPALFSFTEHVAAVKALAWCPWQNNLLSSGGGTADRKIHFWNTSTGALLNSVDTKSKVCSLLWSKYDRELVSSHGFSQNQLIVWKYPSLRKVAELTGHTSRVLHLAQSPDGSSVVSAAGDQTLRFWKIFSSATDILHASGNSSGSSFGTKQFGRFFSSNESMYNESHSLNDMMTLR